MKKDKWEATKQRDRADRAEAELASLKGVLRERLNAITTEVDGRERHWQDVAEALRSDLARSEAESAKLGRHIEALASEVAALKHERDRWEREADELRTELGSKL